MDDIKTQIVSKKPIKLTLGKTHSVKYKIRPLIFLVITFCNVLLAQDSSDFNTSMMRSTFKIKGMKTGSKMGTAFILIDRRGKSKSTNSYVLITAKHVLDSILTDSAVVDLRYPIGDNFNRFPQTVAIRSRGLNLYTSHPTEDVAVMPISLPTYADIGFQTIDMLATDSLLNIINIHPGEDLLVLGYPLDYEYNKAEFPILRSGKVASYPIIPAKDYRTFFLDFEVYGGNSGGPVFINRTDDAIFHKYIYNIIIGLVSGEAYSETLVAANGKKTPQKNLLKLALIVHAKYILETINLLPKSK